MQPDGKKRLGRFIKGGSSMLSKVSLNDFSFDDITNIKTILPDNTRKTVIHAPYHEPEDISTAVKPFSKMEQDLVPPHMRRPVIMPLDFSKDWERDRRSRRSGRGAQDDDEFDYEDAMAVARAARETAKKGAQDDASTEKNASSQAESTPNNSLDTQFTTPNSSANPGSQAKDQEARPIDPAKLLQFPSQIPSTGLNWGSMDIAGKAINDLGHKGSADISSHVNLVATSAEGQNNQDEFIPNVVTHSDQGNFQDPELQSAEKYKARVAEKQLDQEEIKHQIEEQKALGYRDGFRVGEEKAELQMRAASKEMFEKVQGLIHEFQGLQKAMMENVQENFFIVCQALAESLLKREFTIHPDAFNAVMERAITEAIEPGKVKIRVHPDTYDRIAALGKNPLLESIVKDAEITPGDFKLESQMSVVDVNIGKLVAQLLSQADLNLFAEEERAG